MVHGKLTPAAARVELMSAAADDYRKAHALHQAAHLLGARTKSSLARDIAAMAPQLRGHLDEAERARREALAARAPQTDVAAISVSVDRTGLPFEEPLKRKPGRPKQGAPKKPCQVVKRQVYCACLTLHDQHGEALSTQRFAALPGQGDQLTELAGHSLEQLVQRYPEAKRIGLCDGAVEMQRRVREIAGEHDLEAELVDVWHAASYVSQAFAAVGRSESYGREMVRRLVENKSGVSENLMRLRTEGMPEGSGPAEWTAAIRYLENNQERMGYAQARARGLPIGSGSVEATCKCVVAVRFKRSGARWKPEGAETLLHVRAWLTSDEEVAQPILDDFLDSYVTPLAA